jgi:hypothetical protein
VGKWCVGVGVLVEDKEALEDLEILFVEKGASDTVIQFLIGKRSLGLKALVRKGRPRSITQC